MPTLDIIVPHYEEPWEVGQPFFDMLGCQRGISFDDIRVILVHDGTKPFPVRKFARYPFTVQQYALDYSKGVSAARNYGLDMATAEWVSFSDFDDTYSNVYALMGILEQTKNDVDYMWTPFWSEARTKDGGLTAREQGENITWIHGKYFRRQWLVDNEIRFPEGIHYSEDSAFGAIVNELAADGRRGKIKSGFPAYIWVYRENSVCLNPENEERNMTGFIERNFWVVEEFKRRNIPRVRMIGRMFADAYHAFHQKERKFPEHETYFASKAKQYIPELKQNTGEDMKKIMHAAGAAFKGKEMEFNETFTEWVNRIRMD